VQALWTGWDAREKINAEVAEETRRTRRLGDKPQCARRFASRKHVFRIVRKFSSPEKTQAKACATGVEVDQRQP